MANCLVCERPVPHLSEVLGVCGDCLRDRFPAARLRVEAVHAASRAEFDLPSYPPRAPDGVRCNLCANGCLLAEGGRGYCGLRTVRAGRLVHLAGTAARGLLHWYRDPLPTNCVADWVCEGSHHPGNHNLAVFYQSCTMNCLYCQNGHFRQVSPDREGGISARELADVADEHTFCVCYFGGDPASQMGHALAVSRHLAARGVRICWETNGTMRPELLDRAVDYALDTGGCIKFDLKAFDEGIHIGLTGMSNRHTLENFARALRRYGSRPRPPPVVASTLLVPGYVDADQVYKIARFIAARDPRVPYALLAFAPQCFMPDLPCTSRQQAADAEEAARMAGLVNVRVGNRHLLV